MPKLYSKTALVTGGARGIGEAIARCFATEGAHVVIGDVDADNGVRVASEIGGTFSRSTCRQKIIGTRWRSLIQSSTSL